MRDEGRGTRDEGVFALLPRQRRESRRMAARTVAGGRARSARPPDQICAMGVRPRMGSRIKYQAAWIPSATAAAVGKSGRVRRSGGLALRARPPATIRDAIRRRNRGFARVSPHRDRLPPRRDEGRRVRIINSGDGLSLLPRQRRESRRMAARTVAGGRARSARPPGNTTRSDFRPRQRSRRELTPPGI